MTMALLISDHVVCQVIHNPEIDLSLLSDADVAEMNWSDRCPVVWIWTPCRPGV